MAVWWPNLLFWIFGGAVVVCSVGVLVARDIVRAAVWLLLALGNTAALYFLLGADLIGAAQLLVYVGGTLVLVVFGVMLTARKPFIKLDTRGGDWVIGVTVGSIVFAVLVILLLDAYWPRAVRPGAQPTSLDEIDTYQLAATSPNTRQIGLYLLGIPAPHARHLDKANQIARQAIVQDQATAGESAGAAARPSGQESEPPGDQNVTGTERTTDSAVPKPAAKSQARAKQTRLIGYLLPFEIVSVHFLVVLIGAAYLARARRRRR